MLSANHVRMLRSVCLIEKLMRTLILSILFSVSLLAEEPVIPWSTEYNFYRWSEKFDDVDDNLRARSRLDRIKHISLGRSSFLSLGGDYRIRYTGAKNPRFGIPPATTEHIASGDQNAVDNTLGTYEPLLSNPAYISEAAIYYPHNIMELHPSLGFSTHGTFHADIGFNLIYRQRSSDALYASTGSPLVAPGASTSHYNGYLRNAGGRDPHCVALSCGLWF